MLFLLVLLELLRVADLFRLPKARLRGGVGYSRDFGQIPDSVFNRFLWIMAHWSNLCLGPSFCTPTPSCLHDYAEAGGLQLLRV